MNSSDKKIKHLSTKQASNYLGLHPRTIQRLAKKGKIKSIRLGRLLKYRESDIKQYLELGTDFLNQPAVKNTNLFERRDYPRINSNFDCRYLINLPPFKNIDGFGIVKNISAGGVFILTKTTADNIDINDPVSLNFNLNTEDIQVGIRTKGRVVRKDTDGMGVKFRNMDEETKNRIIEYIE